MLNIAEFRYKPNIDMKEPLAVKLCSCIKKVRRKDPVGTRKAKEQRAIAICIKSVLHRRGKTMKRFRCKNGPKLELQDLRLPL